MLPLDERLAAIGTISFPVHLATALKAFFCLPQLVDTGGNVNAPLVPPLPGVWGTAGD